MNLFFRALIVCLLASFACAQQSQPGGGFQSKGQGPGEPRMRSFRPSPKMVEAITGLVKSMEKAWNAGDIAGLSANMADDVDFITPAGLAIKGKKDLDKRHTEIFEKYFKGSHQTATVKQTRFVRPRVVVCDVDVEITHYKAVPPGLAAKSGKPLRMRTRYVMSQEGRDWVITSGQSTEER